MLQCIFNDYSTRRDIYGPKYVIAEMSDINIQCLERLLCYFWLQCEVDPKEIKCKNLAIDASANRLKCILILNAETLSMTRRKIGNTMQDLLGIQGKRC